MNQADSRCGAEPGGIANPGERQSAATHWSPLCFAMVVALTANVGASAFADETPFVPDPWQYGRHIDNSTLTFCLDKRDQDWPVGEDIGKAIASALLLQPKEVVIDNALTVDDLDDVYATMLASCDVYLGFELLPGAYANWMTITRAYYQTSYVLVVADPAWKSLADIPVSESIGTAVGTAEDFRFIQYLESLPASRQWSRIPLSTNDAAVQALKDGTVRAALVWGPSFWAAQQADQSLAKFHPISLSPLPSSDIGVGAAVLADESFLLTNVDKAIQSLVGDGTIATILAQHHFPATPAKSAE